MDEHEGLRREIESLRASNEELLQRAVDAEQAMAALARDEVDAITVATIETPVLLHAAQNELRRSKGLLRAVFDGALDAMLLADDAGAYLDVNLAGCDLFGASRDRILGRTFADLLGTGAEGTTAPEHLVGNGVTRAQFALQRSDGSLRLLEGGVVANVSPGVHLTVLRDVTDRIVAEGAVARSEARFRTLAEKSSEVVALVDRAGTLLYVSPTVTQMLGWTPKEMLGKERGYYVFPEDRPRLAAAHDRLLHGTQEISMALRAVHRDGSIRWLELTGRNLLADPNVGAIVDNLRDVTERVEAEKATREIHRRLEEAQAIAHVGSWTVEFPEGMVRWSGEGARILGVSESAPMTAVEFFELVHPDDREPLRRSVRDAVEHGTMADIEHRVVRPDGGVRWVHQLGAIERGADGRPTRMVGTVQDVTESHLAIDALRASEAEFRLLAEAMPQIVWITRPDGGRVYFNQRWMDYTGLTLEESVGDGWLKPIHPDDKPMALEAWRTAVATAGTYSIECRLLRADGLYRWWLIRGVPIHDASGTILKWFGTCTDIDALKQGEAKQRENEGLLRIAGQAAHLGGWSLTVPDLSLTWSDEVCNIHDVPVGTVPDMGTAVGYYAPEFRETIRDKIDACVQHGAPFDLELQIVTAKHRKVWVRAIGAAERDASGAVTSVRGAFQDVDNRRKLQEQLRQTQKMEAVGRLAGGVAHDFNNLLSVVLSYADLTIDALKPGDPLREDMMEIRAAGRRATELTKQLLAFSRQQVLQPRVIDLDEIIAGMRSMLGRLLGEDIVLSIATARTPGRVLADPGQVEQVLMNLAINARDAMPDGGRLTVETSIVHIDATNGNAHAGRPEGQYVVLSVRDSGTGMDAATRARIFEPFFTTKEKGKGTGLGLATVFGIVEQSGGHVSVHSELGQGSTFRVYFPRTDRVASPPTSVAPATALRGSETILLVEDEAAVRAIASEILRRNGYAVLEASNGGEAFLISKDYASAIDLMLTDVVMPRMSGRKLAEHLATERPAMKVLFTSGYTDDAIVHHGGLNSDVSFLQKPFTPATLLAKIREVLDVDPTTIHGLTTLGNA